MLKHLLVLQLNKVQLRASATPLSPSESQIKPPQYRRHLAFGRRRCLGIVMFAVVARKLLLNPSILRAPKGDAARAGDVWACWSCGLRKTASMASKINRPTLKPRFHIKLQVHNPHSPRARAPRARARKPARQGSNSLHNMGPTLTGRRRQSLKIILNTPTIRTWFMIRRWI